MPDPTQHSLPEVPDEALDAAVEAGDEATGKHTNRELLAKMFAAALPSLHAAWEKDFLAKLRDRTISTELLEFTRAEFEAEVKGNDSDRWFVSVMENGQIDRSWPASCEDGETPQERLMGAGVRIVAAVAETRLRDLEAAPNVLSREEARAISEVNAGSPTPEQEQLALRALGRLADWAEERTG